MWGQEYRTSSAECAAALDAYYAAFLSFGRGRVAAVLRAAAADPSCALAAAHAAHAVSPRDPVRAAASLATAHAVQAVALRDPARAAASTVPPLPAPATAALAMARVPAPAWPVFGMPPAVAPFWTPPAQPSQQTWPGGGTRPHWRSPSVPWG